MTLLATAATGICRMRSVKRSRESAASRAASAPANAEGAAQR